MRISCWNQCEYVSIEDFPAGSVVRLYFSLGLAFRLYFGGQRQRRRGDARSHNEKKWRLAAEFVLTSLVDFANCCFQFKLTHGISILSAGLILISEKTSRLPAGNRAG